MNCEGAVVFPGHFGVWMVWVHSGLAWLQQGLQGCRDFKAENRERDPGTAAF